MKKLILFYLGCLSLVGISQNEDSTRLKRLYFYFDMGWVASPDKVGSQLDYGISVDYNPGLRFQQTISASHSLLLELGYHNVHFHLKQSSDKTLPDTTLFDRERFYVHSLSVGANFRTELSNDFYFDAGVALDYNFRTVHMIKNPNAKGKSVKTFDSGIEYFHALNADFMVRLGYHNWTLHYVFRISPLLKKHFGYRKLPFGVAGIGYSIPLTR